MKSKVRHHYLFLITMLVTAGLLFLMIPKPVWAETVDHEMVLSGDIGDLEIEADIQRVVLAGVTQSDDTELTINGDVVIEIQDGTENKLSAIDASGNVEFVGAGNLEIQQIFTTGEMLVFDHSGEIIFPSGGICGISSDIYFNSGTVNSTASKDSIFAVFTYYGNIYMNGGSLNASGSIGAVYAGGQISLVGGKITASATSGGAFNAGRGEAGSITMSEAFQLENDMYLAEVESDMEGVTVSSIADKHGNGAAAVVGEGPDNYEEIKLSAERLNEIMYTQVNTQSESQSSESLEDTENTESLDDTESSEGLEDTEGAESIGDVQSESDAAETATETLQEEKSISPVAVVVICILIAAVGAAIGMVFPKKKNKKNGKH